jgi:hypothetical protein
MPNYRAKGSELMRELGRRGGVKSGETRSRKRIERLLAEYQWRKYGIKPVAGDDRYPASVYYVWEFTGRRFTLEQISEAMRPEDKRGGSHNTDWRCPHCGNFSSIKRWYCGVCHHIAPMNGRLTRAALRERSAEHRTQAILSKFGISDQP